MPRLHIPSPLRAYTAGQRELRLRGDTVAEALDDLVSQFPALKRHLFNDAGELRPFVNLFLGEVNIQELQGMQTPLREDDLLNLIPSLAGGC